MSTLKSLADFAADAIGLVFGIFAWVLIVVIPLEYVVLPIMSRGFALPANARIAGVVFLFGLFLKWVANGIYERRISGMIISSVLCVSFGILYLFGAFILGSSPFLLAKYLLVGTFSLLSAFCLLYVLFHERVPA